MYCYISWFMLPHTNTGSADRKQRYETASRVQDKHRQTDAPVSLFPSPLPPRPIHSHTDTQSRQVQVTVTAHYSSDTFGPDWNACFPSFLVYLIGVRVFPPSP